MLSAEEIRELEERLPEGRSLRSGLAAVTGYTLGLSKALVGVFIYDVITANVSSIESETNNNRYAQQVCFNSAGNEVSSRAIDESEYEYNPYEDADVYDNNLARQTGILTDTDTATDSDTTLLTSIDTDTDSVDTNVSNSNVATCIIVYRNR